VLSHEEEALVSLIGVQAGRPVLRDTAVVDVGGGSTEVLAVGPSREPEAVGLPLGATRLTGMHVHNDPPTDAEVATLLGSSLLEMARAPSFAPAELVAVGGTARSLLRVGPRLANRALTHRRVRRALTLMTLAPAEATAERYGVRLSRAHVLAAGASILLGALDRYRLDRLRVAAGGLRDGLIFAADRAGAEWRGELRDLARGWDR
jgi:exopolyphosphatase / guanosine-5'-triphosphate,3'-diphosphate pyrophosphatase